MDKPKKYTTPWRAIAPTAFGDHRVHDSEGRLVAQASSEDVACLIAIAPELLAFAAAESYRDCESDNTHATHGTMCLRCYASTLVAKAEGRSDR